MNKNTIADQLPARLVMRSRSPQAASLAPGSGSGAGLDESRPAADAGRNALPGAFPFEALDDRIAITLAEVDLTGITAALAAVATESLPRTRSGDPGTPKEDCRRYAQLEHELATATARIELLEGENRELNSRLAEIAALAAGAAPTPVRAIFGAAPRPKNDEKPVRPLRVVAKHTAPVSGDGIHPAARKLLAALAQHAPGRFTWGQAATLAGLKPSGGHFNAGRKDLRAGGYVTETNGLVTPTPDGLKAAGEVPPAPSTPVERLAMWCNRLPSPA